LNIREADLPGIGKKFQVETRTGDKLTIINHNDGRQEIYYFTQDDPDESVCMVTLEDDEARQIAGIIGGMSYRPKALETIETSLEDLAIEWYKIEPSAKSIGKTIGELKIRQKSGASIIAIIAKDRSTKINPGPDAVLAAHSTLVVSGERRHISKLKEIIAHGE
jgi:TrkA domain protein